MRGRTYQFNNDGIKSWLSLVFYCNGIEHFLDNTSENSGPLVITISSDHSVEQGSIYHTVKNKNSGEWPGNQFNGTILHKTVNETDENGNGDYDFYYGTIAIDIHNAFGSVSYYCFNHGYMGGKYAFTNYDTFS
jgi:hypothetical protein